MSEKGIKTGKRHVIRVRFAQRLNELCDRAGIPELGKGRVVRLSSVFGVTAMCAGSWLKGRTMPRLGKAQEMAEYFGVELEWLLTGLRTASGEGADAPLTLDEHEMLASYRELDPDTRQVVLKQMRGLCNG